MQLLWKSLNSEADARRLSAKCGKVIGVRRSIVSSTGEGVKLINTITDLPININIVHVRKTLPLNFHDYRTEVIQNVANKLMITPAYLSIENEALYFEENFDLAMLNDMTVWNNTFWSNGGIIASNSGTPMPICAALTYDYYEQTQGTKAAEDFKARYKPAWIATDDKKLLAHKELNVLHKRIMQPFIYTFHYNVDYSTQNCLEDIIIALKYYCRGWVIACNELSVKYKDPALVDKAMQVLSAYDIPTCIYSVDEVGWADLFTPEMEDVVLKYI